MDPLLASVLILSVLVLLLIAGGAGLLRRLRALEAAVYRRVGLRLSALPAGPDANSALVRPGATTVIAKLTDRCPVCEEVLAALGNAAPGIEGRIDLVVAITERSKLTHKIPAGVRVIDNPAVWRSIDIPYLPALLIVDESGVVIHTTPAGSADTVDTVIHRALNRGNNEVTIP